MAMYIYSASVDVQKLTSKNMAMVTHMPDLIQGSVSSFVPGRWDIRIAPDALLSAAIFRVNEVGILKETFFFVLF